MSQDDFKIVSITSGQSYDNEACMTIQHVYGLGNNGKVYEWLWDRAEWILWAKV